MTKWSNAECETRILIKLLLSMTYIFIVFLMWVSPLVHDAIHLCTSMTLSNIELEYPPPPPGAYYRQDNAKPVQKSNMFDFVIVAICTVDCHLCNPTLGEGPRVVVSTAAFHARVRVSVPGLGGLKKTENVSSPSTCKSQYCGEPPWPRGSVLGLRPPGLEFRILCLEDSVISIISPPSGGSPGPV